MWYGIGGGGGTDKIANEGTSRNQQTLHVSNEADFSYDGIKAQFQINTTTTVSVTVRAILN